MTSRSSTTDHSVRSILGVRICDEKEKPPDSDPTGSPFSPASVVPRSTAFNSQSWNTDFNTANHNFSTTENRTVLDFVDNRNGRLISDEGQWLNGAAPSDDGPQLQLENEELWRQFCGLSTEMVITKSGRRMFPALKLKVTGLDPKVKYVIMLDIIPVDCYRYKYQDSRWVVAGKADHQTIISRQFYVHPDSPAQGDHWMNRTLSFHKLKLTNNIANKHGNAAVAE